MKQCAANRSIRASLIVSLLVCLICVDTLAQKKKPKPSSAKPKPVVEEPQSDLAKLRDQYVSTTKEYKASLERLLALYQNALKKAEEKRDQAQKLFADGLMSQREVEKTEGDVTSARLKVTETQTQITGADTQIAQALVEVEGEKEIAKLGPMSRGSLIRTTSFIRYNGAGAWALTQAPKIETFFQQTFKRPLPIAVFGQGAIHNQWRLDHRNAMDISLNPDGAEGQALINSSSKTAFLFRRFARRFPAWRRARIFTSGGHLIGTDLGG